MAACKSLQLIFEKPLNENPFETFSAWSPIQKMNPVDNSSLTVLFGELHFHENHHVESSTPPFSSSPASVLPSSSTISDSNNHGSTGIEKLYGDDNKGHKAPCEKNQYMHGDSFSSMSSEPLSHCSEGFGFESSDEVDEFGNDNMSLDWRHRREEKQGANIIQYRSEYMYCDRMRSRVYGESFPPPISCIGSNGKPFVSFRTCRENGRFILTEVRIPQQEFLRASRENGCLKLQLIHPDYDLFEDEEEFDDDDDDYEDDDEEDYDPKDITEVDDEDTTRDDSVNHGEKEEIFEINLSDEEQEPINTIVEN